ncbi:MAG: hypothetical protein PHC60_06660 [Heliobacteriaceae bacterium]|nr:hypothetical protein [Heliobacteriaceae bacterium]MDD4588049.1 hypothetical protein [Heliobacteriaceae bacterium]
MRYNPVYSAFEKIRAMNNLKNYQGLLAEEMRKSDPNFEVVKYYRQRLALCREILQGK